MGTRYNRYLAIMPEAVGMMVIKSSYVNWQLSDRIKVQLFG